MAQLCESHKRSPELLYLGECAACELKALRDLLRSYVKDEDRYNRGDGEPFGSISTETGIAARRAIKA